VKLTQEQVDKNKAYSKKSGVKLDEDGYIIVSENVPILFVGGVTVTEEVKQDGKQENPS